MNTTLILVIAILALVIIAALSSHGKVRASIKGWFKLHASNDAPPPTPGVQMENVKSTSGGITGQDKTGRGLTIKGAQADKDITVTSEPPDRGPNPNA